MINNLTFIKATEEENNSFVGLKIKENEVIFSYPVYYDFDETNLCVEDIISILNTISLSKSKSKSPAELCDTRNNNNDLALYSYIWLIKDYLTNGYYRQLRQSYSDVFPGKICWKKTIQQKNPIISGRNLVYLDLVCSFRNHQENIIS